jgi:hypothetical protein
MERRWWSGWVNVIWYRFDQNVLDGAIPLVGILVGAIHELPQQSTLHDLDLFLTNPDNP